MAENLVALFNNSFRDALVRTSSAQLGESAQSISSSLDIMLPSLVGYLISRGNTDAGAKGLVDFMNGNDLISVNSLSDLSANSEISLERISEKGAATLSYLAGNQTTPLIDAVAAGAGLKTSSASAMLKAVAPLLLGYFGQWIKEKSLGITGIKDLLISQTDLVSSGIPVALQQLKESLNPVPPAQHSSAFNTNGIPSSTPMGISKVLPWLILLIASLGLFYFLEKGCNHTTPIEKSPPVEMRDTI